MIVVKIELWPQGDASRMHELGRTYIWNDATTGDPARGNYGVAVCRRGVFGWPNALNSATRRGEVRDYPRLSYNVWRLIIRALLSAFPEERGTR